MASSASAQGVFGGGNSAFDPTISVVNSGAILDAQVVVSHDQKYVTINARPSVSKLQTLRQFPVGPAMGLGFVGSPAIRQAYDRENGVPKPPPVLPTPSPLDRRGMNKID